MTIGRAEVESGQWRRLRDSADAILTTAQPWSAKPAGLLDYYPDNPRQILAVLTAHPRSVAEVKYPHAGEDAPVCGELIEAPYSCMDAQRIARRPIFLGWPLATFGAAWMQQLGITGALIERERTGNGQVLTTSLVDGIAILGCARAARELYPDNIGFNNLATTGAVGTPLSLTITKATEPMEAFVEAAG